MKQAVTYCIEMLDEGEVKLTPQRLDINKTKIGHLRRLVDDLGTLSQVEAGALDIQLQPVQPAELLQRLSAHRGPPGSGADTGRG